ELNLIEQFWSVLKEKVKQSQFNDTEDLKTRISDTCLHIRVSTLVNIIQHSVNTFEKCLN
ncbi:uncharacterized protein B0P05DRAFT_457542, partial [Gilbertella persicaria]|uniref:uncharacterized protein n=1 Tax=Gilbertella persicaria TaxID=101096 RepID=UPI0022204D91